MSRFVRILLICAAVIAGAYLFLLFVLVNFPYEALLLRLGASMREHDGVRMTAERVGYRYPLSISLRGLTLFHEASETEYSADALLLTLRLKPFSPSRLVEMTASGIDVSGPALNLRGGSGTCRVGVKLRRLIGDGVFGGVSSAELLVGRADIDRLFISGLEFDDMSLRRIGLTLLAEGEGFALQEGTIVLDVVKAELSGSLDGRNMDVRVHVTLTSDFYDRFGNMQGVISTFFKDGSMDMTIHGPLLKPVVSIEQGQR
jgi:hypothetical protein